MRNIFPILALLLITGCASTKIYSDYPLAKDSQNTATFIITRPNYPWGCVIRSPIYINNQLIGRIGPGGRIEIKVPTGRASISVTTSDIVIDAKKNSIYYFKVTLPFQIWWMTPSFNIEQIQTSE